MFRVIHILRKFEPNEWGGIETHLVGLIPELTRLGWESEVHAPAESGTDGRPLEALGATFKTFQASYPYLGLTPSRRARLVAAGGNLLSSGELVRLVRTGRGHLFHTHTQGRLGGIVRTAARARRIPYAVSLHGPVRADMAVVERDATERTRGLVDIGAPLGWALGARRVVQDADLVFAFNEAELEAWRRDRASRHLELATHGVDLDIGAGEMLGRARELAGQEPYILVLGRLDRAKGQDVALRAFAKLSTHTHRLIVAGAAVDAAFASELHELAKPLGDKVRIVGGVPPKLARALMREAALCVIPSRAEPFGIVLLEAWAEGAAVLFSEVGGLSRIAATTDARSGLFANGDVDALALRLERELSGGDWSERERREGRARVARHFSWKTQAERLVASYERAIRSA